MPSCRNRPAPPPRQGPAVRPFLGRVSGSHGRRDGQGVVRVAVYLGTDQARRLRHLLGREELGVPRGASRVLAVALERYLTEREGRG